MRDRLIELFYDNNVHCDQKIEELADDVIDTVRAKAIKGFEDKIKDKFDKHGVDYTAYAIVENVSKEVVGDDK